MKKQTINHLLIYIPLLDVIILTFLFPIICCFILHPLHSKRG